MGVECPAQVRAEEARSLAQQSWGVLRRNRWLLLKRWKRLTGEQRWKLRPILPWDLKTVRAYILEGALQPMRECRSPTYARQYLGVWCHQALRRRLEAIKKVARYHKLGDLPQPQVAHRFCCGGLPKRLEVMDLQ